MMTPRGFDRAMRMSGLSIDEVAGRAGCAPKSVRMMRRSTRPWAKLTPAVRCALHDLWQARLDERFRAARRARAGAAWSGCRPESVLEAAAALDAAGERRLADLLLRAFPGSLSRVAAGVAVHALMRGVPEVWDLLCLAGPADFDLADSWWWDAQETLEFVWSPVPKDLIP